MSSEIGTAVSFKPLGDAELDVIARCQSDTDIADMFDCKPGWALLSVAQLKEKVAEELKKPLTAVFAIHSGGKLIGLGEWSARWDTWSPYAWFVVLPEHRRRGLGTAIIGVLLDKSFLENPGHEVATAVSESNHQAIALLNKLGFTEIGRMRRASIEAGEYRDIVFFDILKSEYLAGVKQ